MFKRTLFILIISMGLFSFLSKAQKKPNRNVAYIELYSLLFCDDINLFRTIEASKAGYPWDVLLSSSSSVSDLDKVANDKSLESRQRLLAYRAMAAKGSPVKDKQLLGVVIEVGMEEGLDVLAAYNDGTARFFSYSEKLTVWEAPTPESNAIIQQLLTRSLSTANQIGLWDKARLPHPQKGMVRISFLQSNGMSFGQGPFDLFMKDEMAGPILETGAELISFFTEQHKRMK